MKLQHKSACSCGHDHSHGEDGGHCHREDKGHCHCNEGHCHSESGNHEQHDSSANTSMRHQYKVDGMNCNHCRTNVEKVIMSVPGVEDVSVDLLSGIADVGGKHLDDEAIIAAVESIGFDIHRK